MFEVKGKYASAKIFTDNADANVVQQIYSLLNHPISEGAQIRIMPDTHVGAGCVIGYTSTVTDKVCPNLIGVDIGCGVVGWKLGKPQFSFEELDNYIRLEIPSGFSARTPDKSIHAFTNELYHKIETICLNASINNDRVLNSIGTLGGGNHFIEIDKEDYGDFWLVIHSGSRGFGMGVATFHQRKAKTILGKMNGLEYLEDKNAEDYLEDMEVAQQYAWLNRIVIGHQLIKDFFKIDHPSQVENVHSVHNYIDFSDNIIRKGAIRANLNERVIIPWNMKDGTIIGTGKGNSDWNSSAPHGAGRKMSRTVAKDKITMSDFSNAMEGVWSTSIKKSTIDEAPMAYKDYNEVKENLTDSVEIELTLKPVYNFKAS